MPINSEKNISLFTECLDVIQSIIEIEKTNSVEAFYILGDFNAHPNEIFYKELMNFCNDNLWCCADELKLGLHSNTFTFRSDAHGCLRWLDHCIVTQSALATIRNIWVQHDVYWSDHFPLIIECNLFRLNEKVSPVIYDDFIKRIMWGDRQIKQIEKYHEMCHMGLRKVDFPSELQLCGNGFCQNTDHHVIIDQLYSSIISILSNAAIQSYIVKKTHRKKKHVIGWNKYVADTHREARLKFLTWVTAGKPSGGIFYNEMLESRRTFKRKLKWCQDREEQLKMDTLALNHSKKMFKSFWKNTNKVNCKSSLPAAVGGIQDHKMIAELFREHFSVSSPLGSSSGKMSDGGAVGTSGVLISAKNISEVLKNMKRGKSPGHDALAMLFNLCLAHSYLPKSLMRTVVVPIIKNKTGDSSDKNNYRPISLATITAKVLDSVINSKLTRKLNLIDAQFGFRADLSTESAILSLKHTIRYYTKRRTSVYACFLDLSKAFDLVAYDLLWNKLGDAGVPTDLVSILKFWYSNQTNQVRWAGTLSDEYRLECGVRQGGISSPLLFNLYINQLIERLSSTHVGCYIDGICFNNISYADDMVLLGPSISAVRTLMLLGLPRHCSASGMFAEARTDGFKAIIRKKSASLMQRLRGSTNSLLKAMAVRFDCPFQEHWIGVVIGLK
ncbi:hypothetical protein K1T71_005095 [Dendrolimus kikuchii]|uniref:Uncharacterized protein n=1 Tax=Dendrolimus kikuchii TaxID=765133 RepID=A0ACC1D713_9NEOP|nr:hypothetical protein K1T71_005095 [Dendrolimus kikuchii]